MLYRRLKALTIARTREYWRDRSSLFFSFIMPPILILVMAFVFSGEQKLFTIGVIKQQDSIYNIPPAFKQDYIDIINYDDFNTALVRVQHHQLDMLFKLDNEQQYWVNPESTNARVLEDILDNDKVLKLERHLIEGQAIRYIDWVLPGILGMNLMFSGLYGVGFVIVRYRKNGVLKRLRATPVTPVEFITAQIISRLSIMLFVSITIFSLSNYFLNLLMLGSYWDLFIVSIIGNTSLLAMGMLVASQVKSEELANGLLNALTFPMLLLSEAWFSLDKAPEWVQFISQCLPLTHLIGSARSIMIDGANLVDLTMPLSILGAITLVCLTISARLFRWN